MQRNKRGKSPFDQSSNNWSGNWADAEIYWETELVVSESPTAPARNDLLITERLWQTWPPQSDQLPSPTVEQTHIGYLLVW